MLKVLIPFKVIQEAREFAKRVYKYRGGNPDKFFQGDELKADRKGFEVEFAHCFAFKLPFPKIFQGKKVDEFDCYLAIPNKDRTLQLVKFDIKTSENFLINKEQLVRKKVEAYLFESLDFQDFATNLIFLKLHGWILKAEVVENSELKKFENGSEAYAVNKQALKSPEELFALNQAGGI